MKQEDNLKSSLKEKIKIFDVLEREYDISKETYE
jgi:hypothetical protein